MNALGQNPLLSNSEILLVDDQDKNLQLLGNHLHKEGYEVIFASSGEEALNVLSSGLPDLILLDVMMPGMDGYEVCRRLRADPKTALVPVIFITAKITPEDVLMGFEVGGQDYIAKPVKPKELLARVNTQLALQHARKELTETNRQLKTHIDHQKHTFSILSHDLRSPVSTVGALISELIYAVDHDEEKSVIKEMLEDSSQCIQQLSTLIQDILEWSRMQMDAIRFEPQDFSLLEAVESVISGQAKTAQKKGLTLENEIPADFVIFADINMITTTIRNLISNAIKFTPRGGKIRVWASHEGGNTKVAVEDTGVGMSPQVISQLFKIGEVTSMKGTEHESGSGLGLSLCMGLVERHNGKIDVKSQLGKGTCISFILPQQTNTTE